VINLHDADKVCRLDDFTGRAVHAVAGIGNPARFFAMLRQDGLDVRERPFPDHHPLTATDISADDDLPVLMTEKDAVKCSGFAQPCHWYVQVEAELDDSFKRGLDSLLRGVISG
jgi:tetraacyldisaccharide 4'-kinase